jgi:hypothetical protein
VDLIQALSYKGHGEFRPKHRWEVELGEQMLHCADVIQVSVGEEECLDTILLTFERRNIRYEVVDAEHLLIGELQPEIDEEKIAVAIDDEAIAANLLKSAEWVEAKTSPPWEWLWLLLFWVHPPCPACPERNRGKHNRRAPGPFGASRSGWR